MYILKILLQLTYSYLHCHSTLIIRKSVLYKNKMLFYVLFLGLWQKYDVLDRFQWEIHFSVLFQILHVITNIVPALKNILWCIYIFLKVRVFLPLTIKYRHFKNEYKQR